MSKLFRCGLFGYRKKDVNGYIERISEEFRQKLEESNAETEKLKAGREELENLRRKTEKEKEAISAAIVSAHEKAEKIIEDAREKAEKQRREAIAAVAKENNKLVKIRREINNIKRNAIKTLGSLEEYNKESDSQE